MILLCVVVVKMLSAGTPTIGLSHLTVEVLPWPENNNITNFSLDEANYETCEEWEMDEEKKDEVFEESDWTKDNADYMQKSQSKCEIQRQYTTMPEYISLFYGITCM